METEESCDGFGEGQADVLFQNRMNDWLVNGFYGRVGAWEEMDETCFGIRLQPGPESQKCALHRSWCPHLHPPPLRRRGAEDRHRSPKVWKNALDVSDQRRNKMETGGKKGGGRGPKESTWWSLYFTPMFVFIVLFFIYHMYVFFYQQRNEWTNSKRAKWTHECEGNREKKKS